MYFKDLVGNHLIQEQLIGGVRDNRVSHAQLFSGPEGMGALLAAIAYCRFIACSALTETDGCGTCSSCKKFDSLSHPDLHFSFPIQLAKGSRVSDDHIAEWRKFVLANPYVDYASWMKAIGGEGKQGVIATDESASIVKKLGLKSYEGGYKFLILWLPELLNISAANKLLKLIEEPPDSTLFILVSENPEKIMPTIYSRTQTVGFKPVEDTQIIRFLASNQIDEVLRNRLKEARKGEGNEAFSFQLEDNEAKDLAFLAEGCPGLAIKQRLESGGDSELFNIFRNWMRLSFAKSVSELVLWVDEVDKLGREMQKNILNYGLKIFRECLHIGYLGKQAPRDTEQGMFLNKFAPFVNERNAIELIGELEKAIEHVGRNANSKILFLDVTFKVIILLKR